MKDGLYQVTYQNICAGFVVAEGKVSACAPLLRRNFSYWKTKAQLITAKRKGTSPNDPNTRRKRDDHVRRNSCPH